MTALLGGRSWRSRLDPDELALARWDAEQELREAGRYAVATEDGEPLDCPMCDGLGEDPRSGRRCAHCGGTGLVPARRVQGT